MTNVNVESYTNEISVPLKWNEIQADFSENTVGYIRQNIAKVNMFFT